MSKTTQTLGIEYEVLDLEGDLEGDLTSPVKLRRIVDEEIAWLSGGLFDSLPKVEVPLDSFFPPPDPYRSPKFDSLAPASFHPRSDSLLPAAMDAAPPSSAERAGAWKWTAIAASAAIVMTGALVAQRRPAAPPGMAPAAAMQAPAAAKPAAPAPVRETAAKPASKPAAPVKPVRAATRAPVAAPSAAPEAAPEQAAPAPAAPPPPALDAAPQGVSPQRAAISIASAARGASGCLEADDLRRNMAVTITFAPSGQAIRATIDGGPHRGTAAGSCIAQRLRSATVSPFEGPAVTVHTSISVR